ncbi:DUF2971 domain-containing protein [Pectobacterium polaris]|uniref:DUF2971 domain-containing protein n=1 Tax=Pectobacterium polaris TaxID=2042057 RepID=UPI001F2800EF|nr:DUF2971 domain-containing protein [Pectobacterium polaris]
MYKYFPPERVDVLESKMICFNNPCNFNDPFEFHSLYNLDSFLESIKENLVKCDVISNLSPEMTKWFLGLSFQDKAKFINATKPLMMKLLSANESDILRVAEETFIKFNNEMINVTRVLCLSERFDSLLMWGHYSYSHTGFVLELDDDNDFFHQRRTNEDEYGFLRKVTYKKELDIIDPLGDGVVEHFLSKNEDWKYELEWRMFLPAHQATKKIEHGGLVFDLFSFPACMIKSVILGCKATDELEKIIRTVLKSDEEFSHVKLFKCHCSNERYELITTPIDK